MKFSEYPTNVPKLEDIQRDFGALINEFEKATTVQEATRAVKKIQAYSDELSTDVTIISIRFSLDYTNKEISDANDYLDTIYPYISQLSNRFNKLLVASPFKKDLEKTFGEYLFKMTESSLKCFDDSIMDLMAKEAKLQTEYSKLVSGAKIKFRGETYNLSQMGKFTQDKDRDTRKAAYKATTKFFEKNDKRLGEIYGEMVQIRDEMAKKLGFKNFVELGYLKLGRVDYTADDVKGYRDQIYREVVPFVNRLYKQIAKRAGIKSPKIYDLSQSFIDGNPTPRGDREYLVQQATTMYNEMSPETNEFFNFMVDNGLLDLDARAGKRGGGYMTYMPRYKAPFIFANFNGTQGDVDVLTHEVGHAFQGYQSRDIKVPEYRMPTLEACEIHSMSMEFFAWPWMNLFFDEDKKYHLSHIEGAVKFLPYGVSVDEFQEWVYENPNVTHEDRCAKWREIEKKYLPVRKYTGLKYLEKGTYWLRQGHIFSSPFYYIDYTLAQVLAFQFATEMWKDRDKAWNKYVKLCKLGGRYPFVELLAHAKLRNPFEEGNVKKVINPVKRKIKQLNEELFG
ncbi:MAG TPA: M3 family oligoendopeptidase [Bacilli bacterium]|nr:M3 family oligoendopeptidase [Bacilli bacterium]